MQYRRATSTVRYAYHFSPPHPSELSLAYLATRAAQNNGTDCLDEILNSMYALSVHVLQKEREEVFSLIFSSNST